MKKTFVIAACLIFLGAAAAAQEENEHPRYEIFGGYSFLRAGGDSNLHGWNAALTYNLNRWAGLKVDADGHYLSESGVSVSQHEVMAGPQFSLRNKPVTLFTHALVGTSYLSVGGGGESGSAKAFALALGGGVDLNVSKRVAFRVVQADYLLTHFGSQNQNNYRAATGIVFRFGE